MHAYIYSTPSPHPHTHIHMAFLGVWEGCGGQWQFPDSPERPRGPQKGCKSLREGWGCRFCLGKGLHAEDLKTPGAGKGGDLSVRARTPGMGLPST